LTAANDWILVFTINNKLNNIIKTEKDTLNSMKQCNIVYKISCHDCDATYVGQTKRQLHTRICEHKTDINKKSGPLSVILQRRIELNHEFEWNEIDILVLDRELCCSKILVSKM